MITVDIGGHELEFDLPDEAVITGAVAVVSYQRLHDGEPAAGVHWAQSAITQPHAIGLIRMAQQDIENIDNYDLEPDDD